jgi:hypothetical protein
VKIHCRETFLIITTNNFCHLETNKGIGHKGTTLKTNGDMIRTGFILTRSDANREKSPIGMKSKAMTRNDAITRVK